MIADVAARASRGAPWLDGSENPIGPADVIMMFNEDPAANVVVPRLVAAEADLSRIHILQHVRTAGDREREFAMGADMGLLRRYVAEHPSVRLIAIDPFSAYFGAEKKLNDDQAVRNVTAPLIQLAEETEVAILDNSHLNKTIGLNAIQKVIGAMAVVAIHRMAWMFAPSDNEQDRAERMILPLKRNIAPAGGGIKFTVTAVPVVLDDGTASQQPRIVYRGDADLTAEESISMTAEQKTQIQQVVEILEEELGDHVQKESWLISQRIRAEVQNCSDSLITKGRKVAKVASVKVGKRWQWVIPPPQAEIHPSL